MEARTTNGRAVAAFLDEEPKELSLRGSQSHAQFELLKPLVSAEWCRTQKKV